MNYPLLVALGLLFLALVGILTHPTGRIVSTVLAVVLFALAAVAALLGSGVVG